MDLWTARAAYSPVMLRPDARNVVCIAAMLGACSPAQPEPATLAARVVEPQTTSAALTTAKPAPPAPTATATGVASAPVPPESGAPIAHEVLFQPRPGERVCAIARETRGPHAYGDPREVRVFEDARGRTVRVIRTFVRGAPLQSTVTTITWDSHGNPRLVEEDVEPDGRPDTWWRYTHDERGGVVSRELFHRGTDDAAETWHCHFKGTFSRHGPTTVVVPAPDLWIRAEAVARWPERLPFKGHFICEDAEHGTNNRDTAEYDARGWRVRSTTWLLGQIARGEPPYRDITIRRAADGRVLEEIEKGDHGTTRTTFRWVGARLVEKRLHAKDAERTTYEWDAHGRATRVRELYGTETVPTYDWTIEHRCDPVAAKGGEPLFLSVER